MAKAKENIGVMFKGENFTVIKKNGQKGDLISKHNHPEANVIFTVVKGKVRAFINEEEVFELEAGKVLHFDGDNYINAEFLEDGEVVINLILK